MLPLWECIGESKSDKPLEAIARDLAEDIRRNLRGTLLNEGCKISEYEQDELWLRVLLFTSTFDPELLRTIPHTIFEDLALIYGMQGDYG